MSSSQQPHTVELEEVDRRGIPVATTGPTKKSSWWQRHIALDVPFHACRDFYGRSYGATSYAGPKANQDFHTALERTYLAWLRSSTAFAHFGVVVTQLFRLSKDQFPQIARLGKPLGLISILLAILVICVGAFRCWQQQRLVSNGKIQSCGWDVWIMILLVLGVGPTLAFVSNHLFTQDSTYSLC